MDPNTTPKKNAFFFIRVLSKTISSEDVISLCLARTRERERKKKREESLAFSIRNENAKNENAKKKNVFLPPSSRRSKSDFCRSASFPLFYESIVRWYKKIRSAWSIRGFVFVFVVVFCAKEECQNGRRCRRGRIEDDDDDDDDDEKRGSVATHRVVEKRRHDRNERKKTRDFRSHFSAREGGVGFEPKKKDDFGCERRRKKNLLHRRSLVVGLFDFRR